MTFFGEIFIFLGDFVLFLGEIFLSHTLLEHTKE